MPKAITFEKIRDNPEVRAYIEASNKHLSAMGFTEHGLRHAALVAKNAGAILKHLGYEQKDIELARIAGYMHDIGNSVSREGHGQIGALLSRLILKEMGADYEDIATIMAAIGNHDESVGHIVNAPGAALVLADKGDVHYKRVGDKDKATFDIHDRVNYAVRNSSIELGENTVTLVLEIDSNISPMMDYFEIFLPRMVLCRRAANYLGAEFHLMINGAQVL
ncbi:HD domain-containing protein [Heliorestis acidaminivorans]|uniref:HD domain-containing protein n=1 Tax=Heliorestis acidaminivorans TaxID=553427 RepID=A0A6I0EXL0_9FIRM|nr:HD domain-containing protein [Heliorestis acidaminivorans]KAB2951260.1 HD domain-containing protein [Heliorestis acidaminivorans]